MRQLVLKAIFILLACLPMISKSQSLEELESDRINLPNGWKLTPAGHQVMVGDLPLNIAISPDGTLAAVTNNGQSDQTIHLVDISSEVILDSVIIGKSWMGLVFSGDGRHLYASGGNDNLVIRYTIQDRHLTVSDTIKLGNPWPSRISVAGLAVDEEAGKLYAVTTEDNSLYVLDLRKKTVAGKYQLGGEAYTCLLSPDKKTLYISCWGCDKIIFFNTDVMRITGSIPVGDNPNDLCITRDGNFLYIANANDNSVSVLDTRKRQVIETLSAALYPDSRAGSTTNGVALSDDEHTLYIANADNNCLSVFDVSKPGASESKGYIPTGWYPTCVRTSDKKILVSNGKGLTSIANPYGPNPIRRGAEVTVHKGGKDQSMKVQYIGGLFRGSLSFITIPEEEQMSVFSQAVYHNTPYNKNHEMISEGSEGNPIPQIVGDSSPLKYIFYIIKENRTYDQVLGDIPEGNGDPQLTLFGAKITPNQHALAKEFVLLDNFYVDGEVSADGHNWSMGAYATDFLEKTWPTSYGGRGGEYSSEGRRDIANNKAGFIWNNCKRFGVSYRSYGEFIDDDAPNIPVLEGHFCPWYTSWVQMVRDTARFYQWKRDFDVLLAEDKVPQLNTLRFINDHTLGLSLGKPSPFAQVADNDLAVGMFVDYLSHSPIWKKTLIVIVEDDAQNGPDHIDAHRSTAYLAGGFVKQGFVDHTMYSTSSLLRTIELILGLPPMSQYDASATPLWRCFTNEPSHPPFTFRPAGVDLNEVNTGRNKWQELSETFDFSKEDRVNDGAFNEVIWKAVRGLNSPCPPTVHAAFIRINDEDDNDD